MNDNNCVITATGYYKTGSSAAYDLLKEYSSCTSGIVGEAEFEHLMLYTPNGLFDLEDKLLLGNNIHRSDEALRSFYEEMRRLNDNNFVWFGNYSKKPGPGFMEAVDGFIENLTDIILNCNWSYDYLTTKFSLKHTFGSIKNVLTGRQVVGDFAKGIVYRKKDCTRYSYVTEEEFYKIAEIFFTSYCELIKGENQGSLLMDHCILPHNLYRIDRYLGNMKVILVDRDPRDVFIPVMNEVKSKNVSPRVPCDIEDFILFWKKLRSSVKKADSKSILRIRFEDMFYNYEESVRLIEDFCGLDAKDHVDKYKYFNPEKSIKHLKTFSNCSEYEKEIKRIEESLTEYLYDFPENL
ncbi:MAG: sulfotransferase domain-containing protein [Clostridia bacterium]